MKTPSRGTASGSPEKQCARAADKRPFDIDWVMDRVRDAVRPFPQAALFELAEAGYRSLFEQLVACVISIRTRDETTLPCALNLFAAARTPAALAALGAAEIDALIRASSFHEAKARQILAIAVRSRDAFGGALPCDVHTLLSLAGVGPKCAHLALGIACGQPHIAVDVHVHRVSNRWGYVRAASPERTLEALQQRLPRQYWIEINRLLVPFGKHICTGTLPKCSVCPVLAVCRQVGVEKHR